MVFQGKKVEIKSLVRYDEKIKEFVVTDTTNQLFIKHMKARQLAKRELKKVQKERIIQRVSKKSLKEAKKSFSKEKREMRLEEKVKKQNEKLKRARERIIKQEIKAEKILENIRKNKVLVEGNPVAKKVVTK